MPGRLGFLLLGVLCLSRSSFGADDPPPNSIFRTIGNFCRAVIVAAGGRPGAGGPQDAADIAVVSDLLQESSDFRGEFGAYYLRAQPLRQQLVPLYHQAARVKGTPAEAPIRAEIAAREAELAGIEAGVGQLKARVAAAVKQLPWITRYVLDERTGFLERVTVDLTKVSDADVNRLVRSNPGIRIDVSADANVILQTAEILALGRAELRWNGVATTSGFTYPRLQASPFVSDARGGRVILGVGIQRPKLVTYFGNGHTSDVGTFSYEGAKVWGVFDKEGVLKKAYKVIRHQTAELPLYELEAGDVIRLIGYPSGS